MELWEGKGADGGYIRLMSGVCGQLPQADSNFHTYDHQVRPHQQAVKYI